MTANDAEYVVVGKIGATYGIKGWVKIISFTDPLTNIMDYDPWYFSEGSLWKAAKLKGCKEYGKGLIAKFQGFDVPEIARQLTGKTIAIKRSQLPQLKADEYYWSDLEGLNVINHHEENLGVVTHLIATGTNDVLVVKGSKEQAIPYLPGEVVLDINLMTRTMRVKWDPL